jgi:hypothetical protein
MPSRFQPIVFYHTQQQYHTTTHISLPAWPQVTWLRQLLLQDEGSYPARLAQWCGLKLQPAEHRSLEFLLRGQALVLVAIAMKQRTAVWARKLPAAVKAAAQPGGACALFWPPPQQQGLAGVQEHVPAVIRTPARWLVLPVKLLLLGLLQRVTSGTNRLLQAIDWPQQAQQASSAAGPSARARPTPGKPPAPQHELPAPASTSASAAVAAVAARKGLRTVSLVLREVKHFIECFWARYGLDLSMLSLLLAAFLSCNLLSMGYMVFIAVGMAAPPLHRRMLWSRVIVFCLAGVLVWQYAVFLGKPPPVVEPSPPPPPPPPPPYPFSPPNPPSPPGQSPLPPRPSPLGRPPPPLAPSPPPLTPPSPPLPPTTPPQASNASDPNATAANSSSAVTTNRARLSSLELALLPLHPQHRRLSHNLQEGGSNSTSGTSPVPPPSPAAPAAPPPEAPSPPEAPEAPDSPGWEPADDVWLLRWLGAVGAGPGPLWALFLSFCLCIMQVSCWGGWGKSDLLQCDLSPALLCSACATLLHACAAVLLHCHVASRTSPHASRSSTCCCYTPAGCTITTCTITTCTITTCTDTCLPRALPQVQHDSWTSGRPRHHLYEPLMAAEEEDSMEGSSSRGPRPQAAVHLDIPPRQQQASPLTAATSAAGAAVSRSLFQPMLHSQQPYWSWPDWLRYELVKHSVDMVLVAVVALCSLQRDIIHAGYLAIALLLFRKRLESRAPGAHMFTWLPAFNFLVMVAALAYQAPLELLLGPQYAQACSSKAGPGCALPYLLGFCKLQHAEVPGDAKSALIKDFWHAGAVADILLWVLLRLQTQLCNSSIFRQVMQCVTEERAAATAEVRAEQRQSYKRQADAALQASRLRQARTQRINQLKAAFLDDAQAPYNSGRGSRHLASAHGRDSDQWPVHKSRSSSGLPAAEEYLRTGSPASSVNQFEVAAAVVSPAPAWAGLRQSGSSSSLRRRMGGSSGGLQALAAQQPMTVSTAHARSSSDPAAMRLEEEASLPGSATLAAAAGGAGAGGAQQAQQRALLGPGHRRSMSDSARLAALRASSCQQADAEQSPRAATTPTATAAAVALREGAAGSPGVTWWKGLRMNLAQARQQASLCYSLFVIAFVFDVSLLTLAYPLSMCLYALLVHRAAGAYWRLALMYTEAVLVLQYAYEIVARCLCSVGGSPATGSCVSLMADPQLGRHLDVLGLHGSAARCLPVFLVYLALLVYNYTLLTQPQYGTEAAPAPAAAAGPSRRRRRLTATSAMAAALYSWSNRLVDGLLALAFEAWQLARRVVSEHELGPHWLKLELARPPKSLLDLGLPGVDQQVADACQALLDDLAAADVAAAAVASGQMGQEGLELQPWARHLALANGVDLSRITRLQLRLQTVVDDGSTNTPIILLFEMRPELAAPQAGNWDLGSWPARSITPARDAAAALGRLVRSAAAASAPTGLDELQQEEAQQLAAASLQQQQQSADRPGQQQRQAGLSKQGSGTSRPGSDGALLDLYQAELTEEQLVAMSAEDYMSQQQRQGAARSASLSLPGSAAAAAGPAAEKPTSASYDPFPEPPLEPGWQLSSSLLSVEHHSKPQQDLYTGTALCDFLALIYAAFTYQVVLSSAGGSLADITGEKVGVWGGVQSCACCLMRVTQSLRSPQPPPTDSPQTWHPLLPLPTSATDSPHPLLPPLPPTGAPAGLPLRPGAPLHADCGRQGLLRPGQQRRQGRPAGGPDGAAAARGHVSVLVPRSGRLAPLPPARPAAAQGGLLLPQCAAAEGGLPTACLLHR